MRKLNLEELKKGLPAITKSVGVMLNEATIYCFDRANHGNGLILTIKGGFQNSFQVIWEDEITPQLLRTWNNTKEATEYGAVGVAVMMILELLDMTIVMRSREGSGIDYWLGEIGENNLPIIKAGLEVSGIQEATISNTVNARLTLKKKQSSKSKLLGFPIYVIVVEFKLPEAHFIQS